MQVFIARVSKIASYKSIKTVWGKKRFKNCISLIFTHFDRKISGLLASSFRQCYQNWTSFNVSIGSFLRNFFSKMAPLLCNSFWNLEQKKLDFWQSFLSDLSKLNSTCPGELLKIISSEKTLKFSKLHEKTFSEFGQLFLRGNENSSQLVQRIICRNESCFWKFW